LDKKYAPEEAKAINLKDGYFITQYIYLRNRYADLLLTSPVSLRKTKEWLKKNEIEIYGLAEDNVLLGAIILYMDRDGEVAFFARYPNRGIGSGLLKIIEEVARKKGLRFIWGWVLKDNLIARRAFEKNGFTEAEGSAREYKGINKEGISYRKFLDG